MESSPNITQICSRRASRAENPAIPDIPVIIRGNGNGNPTAKTSVIIRSVIIGIPAIIRGEGLPQTVQRPRCTALPTDVFSRKREGGDAGRGATKVYEGNRASGPGDPPAPHPHHHHHHTHVPDKAPRGYRSEGGAGVGRAPTHRHNQLIN